MVRARVLFTPTVVDLSLRGDDGAAGECNTL